ncbi:MAG: 3-isopropylmalate dehydratase [Candidatus Hodarchaeota archaeon]
MKFENTFWVFNDDDINTDLIFPGKYTYEPLTSEQMAAYAMEDYNPKFASEVKKGEIIVTGKNFGCGSSREQAVTALKYVGVSCIIARSYARIFYRNAINQALPVVISPECVTFVFDNVEKLKNEKININFTEGTIKVLDQTFTFPPMDKQALAIFEAGGLVEYTKMRLKTK